jgi:PEGA domain
MRRFLARTALTTVLGCVAVVTPAMAQERTAADLKKSGNEKMDASDFVGALEDYTAALKQTPDDATLYFNVGRAHGLLGHNVDALAALEEFGKRATPEVRARAQFEQLRAQARAKVAYLSVSCVVPGARVFIGPKVIGDAPLTRVPVDASAEPVRIRIEAEGYREDARTIALPGTEDARLECRLLTKATSGILVVTTDPSGATLSIDGARAGNPPLEVPLSAGQHTVLAQRDGYEDAQVPVVVSAGDAKRTVDIKLTKSAPLTSKWWFWTSIGVVVVGGVVLTAALLTEKPADSGSIKPGQLPAPLVRF